jgi:hypothetical protein
VYIVEAQLHRFTVTTHTSNPIRPNPPSPSPQAVLLPSADVYTEPYPDSWEAFWERLACMTYNTIHCKDTGPKIGTTYSQKGNCAASVLISTFIHCKKESAVFPSPAGMSLIKLFLGGNNLIFPVQGEFNQ